MIKKIILCLCFLLVFSGCESDRGWNPSVDSKMLNEVTIRNPNLIGTDLRDNFIDNSQYEMILWGGPVTYSYYVDDYTIVGNFVVIDKYVEYGSYLDPIIRENRLMLPAGITVIKSRTK